MANPSQPVGAARRRPLLVRIRNLPKTVSNLVRAAHNRARLEREAVSPTVLAFWRTHGGEWAKEEASPEDLDIISTLAGRLAKLSARHREKEVVAALLKIWEAGFSSPTDAIPWHDMHDDMPPAAMLAFVEGAASTAQIRRQA